ncbi:MAG TPA: hypothetical protein VMD98_13480 [Bryocella sp.]|nr:hypothetical protein [Bryocella sp.]
MGRIAFLLLLVGSFAVAQSDNSANTGKNSSDNKVTVRGCIDRERGDYVLLQQNPGMTYELQGTDKAKLRHYLGQRVEVTGTKFPSLPTSSDSVASGGGPASVTIRVSSIKTLAKECSEHPVSTK